jgi:hypothetical protein
MTLTGGVAWVNRWRSPGVQELTLGRRAANAGIKGTVTTWHPIV